MAAPVSLNSVVQAIQHMNSMVEAMGKDLLSLRQRVTAAELREALREVGRKPRLDLTLRAQFGEDVMILDVLDNQLDGFYIEVGAFDGKHFSVTWMLDAIGWDGLLIEPLPSRAEACRVNRPNAHVEHCALGKRGSSGTLKFTEVLGEGVAGMFSFLSTNAAHMKVLREHNAQTQTCEVPVTWMDELLARHPRSPKQVDVAVIDVEGGEIQVLEGFDLERWKPRLLMLEDNERGADPALENWMVRNAPQYRFLTWLEVNRVYFRADDERIQRKLGMT